jgi:hypothetical protein
VLKPPKGKKEKKEKTEKAVQGSKKQSPGRSKGGGLGEQHDPLLPGGAPADGARSGAVAVKPATLGRQESEHTDAFGRVLLR